MPRSILAGAYIGNSGIPCSQESLLPPYPGLIFLLLCSGPEFRLPRFLSRGSGFPVSGLLDLDVNMAVGFSGALAPGFNPVEAFVVGSAFFDTSPAPAAAGLTEYCRLTSPESETMIRLLIFEDLSRLFRAAGPSLHPPQNGRPAGPPQRRPGPHDRRSAEVR